jgi:hypothetical protein
MYFFKKKLITVHQNNLKIYKKINLNKKNSKILKGTTWLQKQIVTK